MFHVTLGECLPNRCTTPFIGIQTESQQGVVDTAAQSGLIGERALRRLEESLKPHQLKGLWTGKKAQARGVGGEAQVIGVIELPLGLGGISGVLECTVVKEDVPLLLPIRLLPDLRAVVDLGKDQLVLKETCTIPMNQLPSGHASIDVLDFGTTGWQLPRAAHDVGRRAEQFHLCVVRDEAMSGTRDRHAWSPNPDCGHHPLCHGADAPLARDGQQGPAGQHGDHGVGTGLVALAVHGKKDAEPGPRVRARAKWCWWRMTRRRASTRRT